MSLKYSKPPNGGPDDRREIDNSTNNSWPEPERKHKMSYWHESMLERLISFFEPDQDILGLILIGSLGKPEIHYDYWSDIDFLVVKTIPLINSFQLLSG